MSTNYTTEPPPSATVLLHTTAGPLTLSIFATQTPLASRNFLQHVLDGTYTNNIFHRVAPGFVIQTGDPSGTGSGGTSIYEDRDSERYDAAWARELGREVGEKIVFGDEVHGRLHFNRRGLIGLAKMGEGDGEGYGSQFFITLGDCRRELDGKCTMFGRVEGEGIYNVVKISEGELVEGTERPVFPEKITSAELLELPKGEAWQGLRKRERVVSQVDEERPKKMAKREKKKGGKALLSFGDEEGEDGPGVVVRPKKAKFNTALIDAGDEDVKEKPRSNGTEPKAQLPPPTRLKEQSPPPGREAHSSHKPDSPSASRSPETTQRRKPSLHESTTQLPIRDPEVPSRSLSATPEPGPNASRTKSLNAEIAALKASMRRDVAPVADSSKKKKSALEQMIPATSTRGRKRPRPGESGGNDASALKVLHAFRARLDGAGPEKMDVDVPASKMASSQTNGHAETQKGSGGAEEDDDEATLCDLHFIANCQSCSKWDQDILDGENGAVEDDENDRDWMGHALSFEKDRLGKDLTWRRKGEDELVVIDPREKEREIKQAQKDRRKGKERI